jgi:hypothetical protein
MLGDMPFPALILELVLHQTKGLSTHDMVKCAGGCAGWRGTVLAAPWLFEKLKLTNCGSFDDEACGWIIKLSKEKLTILSLHGADLLTCGGLVDLGKCPQFTTLTLRECPGCIGVHFNRLILRNLPSSFSSLTLGKGSAFDYADVGKIMTVCPKIEMDLFPCTICQGVCDEPTQCMNDACTAFDQVCKDCIVEGSAPECPGCKRTACRNCAGWNGPSQFEGWNLCANIDICGVCLCMECATWQNPSVMGFTHCENTLCNKTFCWDCAHYPPGCAGIESCRICGCNFCSTCVAETASWPCAALHSLPTTGPIIM